MSLVFLACVCRFHSLFHTLPPLDTQNTAAVRAAAAALAVAGGGTLLFPEAAAAGGHSGAVYLTGAFNLSSNAFLDIQPGATVRGSQQGADWPLVHAQTVWPQFGHGSDCTPGTPACAWMHQAFVFAWNAVNVTIAGGGTLDGGASHDTWWTCAHDLSKPPCDGHGRPHLVMCACRRCELLPRHVVCVSHAVTSPTSFKRHPRGAARQHVHQFPRLDAAHVVGD